MKKPGIWNILEHHALPRRVVEDVPRALQVRRVEHLPHVEPAERDGRGGREQARGDQEAAAAAAHQLFGRSARFREVMAYGSAFLYLQVARV